MSTAPKGTAIQEATAGHSISERPFDRRVVQWRLRLERRRIVREEEIHVPGAARAYALAIPADPDGVLDELAAPEPHMPYWATLWPSGLALAEVALARRRRLVGRRVVELGCGLGTTATALMECGAAVTGIDCFGEALAFARYNVLRNTGRTLRTLRLDWRTESDAQRIAALGASVLLAADVLYEAEDVEPLLALGGAALGRGAEFWVAEPGRATSRRFVERALELGWCEEEDVIQRDWPAMVGSAVVRVHRFTPVASGECGPGPTAR